MTTLEYGKHAHTHAYVTGINKIVREWERIIDDRLSVCACAQSKDKKEIYIKTPRCTVTLATRQPKKRFYPQQQQQKDEQTRGGGDA